MLESERSPAQLPALIVMDAEDVKDEQYRRTIYERLGVAQRIMLADQVRNQWFWIKLVRHEKLGKASAEELARFEKIAPLLISIVRWHIIIVQRRSVAKSENPTHRAEGFLVQLNRRLSPREIEVCSGILEGLSNSEIALKLGIKISSVATLRRRAFYKMEISSSNELFSLYLSQFVI
jgi:DNA-binding CsgD family transcriptional regulator